MERAEKREFVTGLNEVFKNTGSVVVAHYAGLTVAQMNDLRSKMRAAGGTVKVAKNRLAIIALQGTDSEGIRGLFKGQTLIAYAEDPVAALDHRLEGVPDQLQPGVVAEVDFAIDRRHLADVVVDMEKSGFVDSEGLELLLWMKQRCEDLFGRIKLVGIDENVKKILEITRLEARFESHADLASALKTMK